MRLMDDVSKRLKLVNAIGVADGDKLQSTIVDNGLIAGIEFHHSQVSALVIIISTLLDDVAQPQCHIGMNI